MKRKILTSILALALFTFAFSLQSKAENVTVNFANIITSITFYPAGGGGSPYVVNPNSYDYTQTFDVPDGFYTVIAQVGSNYGSFIYTGFMERSYTAYVWNPYANQFDPQSASENQYPDTDTSSPTYGQVQFMYVTVGNGTNNTFTYHGM